MIRTRVRRQILPVLFALCWAGFLSTANIRSAPVTALAFSPDGTALVSNGDRRIDIRSPRDASVQRSIECDLPKITALVFEPHGRWLAVGGGEPGVRGEVRLLSWPQAALVHRIGGSKDVVTGVSFAGQGGRLAVASSDHGAAVWQLHETSEPTLAFQLAGHAGAVLAIAFGPTGRSIVSAGADRSLKVWAPDDGRLVRSLNYHTEAIHALAFRPAGGTPTNNADGAGIGVLVCATAGDDRTVRVWQPEIGRMVRIVRQHDGPIHALAWAPDSGDLFSAGQEGTIRKIDGASDTIKGEWKSHDDWIYALAISPDGKILASGDWSGRVRLQAVRDLNGPERGL